MSMSIGSSSDAQSYLQSLLQMGSGSASAGAGALPFSDPMLTAASGSSGSFDPSAASGLLGVSSSPFQSDTLSSLLSAQGQGGDTTGQACGAGASDGSADSDADGSASGGSTTVQTTINPDGSTTTTTTYADGSTDVTTTPATQDMATSNNAGSNTSGNSSDAGALDQLGKLQSLLAPAASTLMAVL